MTDAYTLPVSSSSTTTLLYAHWSLGLHLRRLDRCYHLLLGCPNRCRRCILTFTLPSARHHLELALLRYIHQTRRARYRETTQVAFPNPPRPLSLQHHELSFGRFPDVRHLSWYKCVWYTVELTS